MKTVPVTSTIRSSGLWSSVFRYVVAAGVISAILVSYFWLWQNKTANQWLEEARQAIDQRDLTKAVTALENAVKAAPDFGSAWKLLADVACRSA